MKTIVTTFALSLALCAAAGATAQVKSTAPAPAADTVMLSQTTDGDYLVRRYMVKSHNDSDYSIRYQINLSKLAASFNGNSKELSDLNSFVENLMQDSLMHVKGVEITGYSSPDGPWKFNEALAKNRAMDFKNYVDKKYDFSKKFDVKTSWVAEDWETTRALVAQSNIADKQKALDIVDGDKWTSDQKEMALKKMPSVWENMRKNILPQLRRVEMVINYGEGNVFEVRTMIPKPAPAPAPAPQEPCCVVIDQTNGIIVQMDEPGNSFKKEVRHDVRNADKAVKAEMKAAQKQAREADKLAKKETRKAEKMAKAAEKAADKIAKAQAKADRKAAKAIDKM